MLLAICGGRAARRHFRPAQVLLQRQRGHLRHHAQLDRAVSDQYAPDHGEGGHQPLHQGADTPTNPMPCCPRWASAQLFNNNQYVGHRHPAVPSLMAIVVWVVLDKTKFGYELKATGYNKNAAKYCGMAEKRNIILTPRHRRRAGRSWARRCSTSPAMSSGSAPPPPSPRMGFNGIAAAFLGGLNPIGTDASPRSSSSTSPPAARMWISPCTARRSPI